MAEHERDQEQERNLAGEVHEHLQDGSVRAAKQALSRAWRDLVPELPARFAVPLRSVDRRAVVEVRKRMARSGKRPPLRLREEEGRIWVETARGSKLRLGRLPSAEAKLLDELGALRRYRPKLMRVEQDERGQIQGVIVELVRPLGRICSSCGILHNDEHANCAECRAKRRRRGPERYEGTAIELQEAIDEVVSEADDFPEF